MLLILSELDPNTTTSAAILNIVGKMLQNKKIDYEIHPFEDVNLILGSGENNIFINDTPINTYSHIYFRKIGRMSDIVHIISSFAKSAHIPIIDTCHTKNNISSTKIFQYYALSKKKISIPKTLFLGKYTKHSYELALKKIGSPIVIKEFYSSKGEGVHIASSFKAFRKIIQEIFQKNSLYLLQEYIPNDFDYRVLVLGGKARVIEKKTRTKDTFRNNVALGATEEFLNISDAPKDILLLAEKAVKPLFLDIAGVDIVVNKETHIPYILEVNKTPQFTLDQTISNEIKEFSDFLSVWTKC